MLAWRPSFCIRRSTFLWFIHTPSSCHKNNFLPVAIPSFVAFIHRVDESFSLGVSVVVLPLQICVVTTSRDAKELAVISYLADVRCLFNELETLFFPSRIQISKHFLASHSPVSTAEHIAPDLNIPSAFLVDPVDQIHPAHGIYASIASFDPYLVFLSVRWFADMSIFLYVQADGLHFDFLRICLKLLTFNCHKKIHPLEIHRLNQGVFPMSVLRGALHIASRAFLSYFKLSMAFCIFLSKFFSVFWNQLIVNSRIRHIHRLCILLGLFYGFSFQPHLIWIPKFRYDLHVDSRLIKIVARYTALNLIQQLSGWIFLFWATTLRFYLLLRRVSHFMRLQ